MPLINVKVIEGVFTSEQKTQIAERLTDAMVSVEGENMRGVTWCLIEEVKSGEWAIGGQCLTTEACTRSPPETPGSPPDVRAASSVERPRPPPRRTFYGGADLHVGHGSSAIAPSGFVGTLDRRLRVAAGADHRHTRVVAGDLTDARAGRHTDASRRAEAGQEPNPPRPRGQSP